MTYNLRITVTNENGGIDRDQVIQAIKFFIDDFKLEIKDSNGNLELVTSPDDLTTIGYQIHDLKNGTFEIYGIQKTHDSNPTINLFQNNFASYLNKYTDGNHLFSSSVI